MRKTRMRAVALFASLLLVLGMIPAVAETQTQVPGLEALLANSGNQRVEVKVQINPQAAAILSMMTGEMPEEGATSVISTVISAINKLKVSVLAGKSGVSAVIGTDAASLMDFQASADPETFETHITSSMLPGLALSVDPAMIKKVMGQMSQGQSDPNEALKIFQLHAEALGGILKEAAAAFKAEEGSFVIEGYGTFTKRTQVTLTTSFLAGVLEKLAALYKKGEVPHKEYMEKLTASVGQVAGDKLPEGSFDLGMLLDAAAAKAKAEPDKTILTGWVYEGEKALYIDAATPEDISQPAKIDVLFTGEGGNTTLSVKLIGKASTFTAGETEKSAALDWAAIEKDILSGQNFMDTMMKLNVKTTSELPSMTTQVTLDLNMGGMNIGLKLNGSSRLDTMESNFSVSLSMNSPEPLLTFSVSSKKTDEQPAAPQLEGTTAMVIKETGLSEEDKAMLQASLQKAIPALLEKLTAAMPEEGPVLMQMLQTMLVPQQPIPTEGITPEAVVEPTPVNP